LSKFYKKRYRITLRGVVQGVGFRPHVFRLARLHGLDGFVRNTPAGVEIEVEGPATTLDRFVSELDSEAPAAAHIIDQLCEELPPRDETGFAITPSHHEETQARALVCPDLALCTHCRRELFDPADRRHRYPFINCTNCGPRFTIIQDLPYDRPATTMARFAMCPACRAEYDNPADRRFHAQPNACPACGPTLSLLDDIGAVTATGDDALREAVRALQAGAVVAIKGLGGFHLAVDADNETVVARLRQRKQRPTKPFALMAKNLAVIREICHLDPVSEEALVSCRAPIVLLPRRRTDRPARSVAPDLDLLGVMLPYTPLHHLLLEDGPELLVMTSGNKSGEPIVTGNDEAVAELAGIADCILCHDRDIHVGCDDSVEIRLGDRVVPLRRSRGHVPRGIVLSDSGPVVLGVGGEIKNAVCILRDDLAFAGQHIGDVTSLAGLRAFIRSIEHLQTILAVRPAAVACDLHPDYLTSRWAEECSLPVIRVQHHHAHLAACLAENRATGPAVGIILDGTGLGTDNTIWGGEILVGDATGFTRLGYLRPFLLAGGERAIREPWRTGIGYLLQAGGPDLLPEHLQTYPWEALTQALEQRINAPVTTSCGRLFDAVAAITGRCVTATYDGEAPMRLAAGMDATVDRLYPVTIEEKDGAVVMDTGPILVAVAEDVRDGIDAATVSARFHATLSQLLVTGAVRAAERKKLDTVALSGGCWANQRLFDLVRRGLEEHGLRVLGHRLLPPGDGCLAVGQAVVGRTYLLAQGVRSKGG